MNCDCKECRRLSRAWAWLESDPGPVSSFVTFAVLLAVLAWWSW